MSYVQTAGQVLTAVIVPPTAAVFVIIFCLPVLVGGIALSWGAIKAVQRYRTVTAQSTDPIGSVTPGQTKLEDRVRSIGETLEQPLTDGTCVYARWKIDDVSTTNTRSGTSETGRRSIAVVLPSHLLSRTTPAKSRCTTSLPPMLMARQHIERAAGYRFPRYSTTSRRHESGSIGQQPASKHSSTAEWVMAS